MTRDSQSLTDVIEMAKKYIANQAELFELKMVSKLSKMLANIMTEASVVVITVLALIFGSLALGFWLSDVFESYSMGFGAVALIYIILVVVVVAIKDSYIEKFIINRIIKKYGDGESKKNK